MARRERFLLIVAVAVAVSVIAVGQRGRAEQRAGDRGLAFDPCNPDKQAGGGQQCGPGGGKGQGSGDCSCSGQGGAGSGSQGTSGGGGGGPCSGGGSGGGASGGGGSGGGGGSSGGSSGGGAGGSELQKDTHRRIDDIYERLGIEKDKEEKEQQSGCGGQQKEQPTQQSTRRRAKMPAFLGYLLLGIVFAAMLIPLIIALRSGYRETPAADDREDDDDDDGEAAGPRSQGPWTVDLSDCRALIQAGRIAEAFGALHRVTLLALERAGHLSLDASTTNWAYVRSLASKPPLRRMLSAVTEAAERSMLGQAPPDESRFWELEGMVSKGI